MSFTDSVDFGDLGSFLATTGFMGAWSVDYAAERVRFSADTARVLPYTSTFLQEGMALSAFERSVHPDDLAWLREQRRKAGGASGQRILEYRLIDRDGIVRRVQSIGRYVLDRYGVPLSARGFAVDVTGLRTESGAVTICPALTLASPLASLADSLLLAYAAASQTPNKGLEGRVKALLMDVGRLLAQEARTVPSTEKSH